jgi:hypothetical protein
MKFIAHRPQDLHDLEELKVAAADIAFVENYLNCLPAKGTTLEEIQEARDFLDAWQSR